MIFLTLSQTLLKKIKGLQEYSNLKVKMKLKSYLMKHKIQIGTQGLLPNAVTSTEEFYNDWTT